MTYKKQQWKTGEIITEGKLNHVEDGIYNTDNSLTESKTLFANNILDLQSNKANQSDVVSINQEIGNISADLAAAEADITTKAAQADVDTISNEVDTLQTQVTTNTNNIKSLQDSAVNKSELDKKQDKLTAGSNITIENNVISATGGSSAPDNMVTTNTTQTISGVKTFTNTLNINSTEGNSSLRLLYSPIGGSLTNSELLNLGNTSFKKMSFGIDDFTINLLGTYKDKNSNNFLTDSPDNRVKISNWGLPDVSSSSYRVVVAASHTEYEMPFDGYMYLQGETTSTGAYCNIDIYTNNEWVTMSTVGYVAAASGLYGISPLIPLAKSAKYRVRYSNMGTLTIICFPLVGGESA